ncbi:MAG: hypothetical protein ABJE10_05410 [bacterium]
MATRADAGRTDILGAYREDVNRRRGEPFGDCDSKWIEFGVLLAHAAMVHAVDRTRCVTAARAIAREILDGEVWDAGYRLDPHPPFDDMTLEGRVRSIAEAVEDAGALALSDAILCAFVHAFPESSPLELGRIEAVRARLAWKGGDREVAAERYQRTAAEAARIGSDELRVRALIGRALLARLAGNYPQSRESARQALIIAEREGMHRLAASAHHTLFVADAVAGAFGTAIVHGWQAFALATGDAVLEAEVLGNLGQLFVDLGHPSTAAAAFRAVVKRRPAQRILLPALGGLAMCCGYLQDLETLAATESAILRYAEESRSRYEVASALLELATASLLAGKDTADRYRAQALEIAAASGFHELVYRAETATQEAQRECHELSPSALNIAHAVRELESV